MLIDFHTHTRASDGALAPAELLRKAGCLVEDNRVRLPAHLVEWALRTAPSHIGLYDRFGKPAVSLGDRISNFGTGKTLTV